MRKYVTPCLSFDEGSVDIDLREDGAVAAYVGSAPKLSSISADLLLDPQNTFAYRMVKCSMHQMRPGKCTEYAEFDILGGRFNTVGICTLYGWAELQGVPLSTAHAWG